MASTYTANSGIEKIGAGEQAGAWGTTTNNNLDILDRAINGVGAITLSGTTHTLTTSDGTLSEGGNKVLVLGGSPSGTNTITFRGRIPAAGAAGDARGSRTTIAGDFPPRCEN